MSARTAATLALFVPVHERPRLRGWFHVVAFVLSIPAGALLVALADPGRARVGAIVYALGMVALFGVSGAYHRGRWSPPVWLRWKRLDHGVILVKIAATYTPICLVVMEGTFATALLVGVWLAAAVGFVIAQTGVAERAAYGILLYLGLGWAAVVTFPQLLSRLDLLAFWLIVTGGLFYTVGATLFGLKRPRFTSTVFGYHELWHVFTIVAVACHYVAIATVVG